MKFANIFEKISSIFDMIISSNILIILVIMLIGCILLKLTNKINNKKLSIILYFVELSSLIYIIFTNKDYLIKLGNDIIDGIFMNFYFPSIYIYLVVFIFSFILFIMMLLNNYLSKTYKTITNVYFYIFNFLFILIIYTISSKNIDVFDKFSLFTCNNALILLELSISLFFLYLLVISLIYVTNYIILKVESKVLLKNNIEDKVLDNVVEEVDNSYAIVNEEDNLNNNYKVNVAFEEITKNISNNEKIDLVPEISLEDIKPSYTLNDYKFIDPTLYNDEKSSVYLDSELKERMNFIDLSLIEKEKNDKLTLKDYKLFSNMLKTILDSNSSNNLSVSELLDKALLTRYSLEDYSKFERILNSCLN